MKDTAGVLNWARCNLEDVCRLVNGRAYKRPELLDAGKYRVLRVGNLFTNGSWFWSDLELDEDKYIDKGDLIYAWSASFGPRIWDGEKVIYHYHIWKCLPDPALLDKHFLYRWFEWDTAKVKADHGTGSTMIHVTKGDMEARPLGLPPLSEQRRIVAQLDRLSARTKAVRAHLVRVQSLASRAKQATLAAAFDPAENPAWRMSTVEKVLAEGLIGLVRSKAQQSDQGTPYIRMNHYDLNGRWNDKDLTFVEVSAKEFQRFELRPQDLLFNTRNSAELVGKVALWPEGRPGHVFNNNLLRMRFRKEIKPAFAYFYMISPVFREFLESVKNATTSVAAIYQKSLMRGPFPVPEIEEQKAIVRCIETTFARIDRMGEEAASAAHLLDRLDQRLLAKAFRGELVPQDPNDEPAADLLARIQAARAAAPKPKRGRRTRA